MLQCAATATAAATPGVVATGGIALVSLTIENAKGGGSGIRLHGSLQQI